MQRAAESGAQSMMERIRPMRKILENKGKARGGKRGGVWGGIRGHIRWEKGKRITIKALVDKSADINPHGKPGKKQQRRERCRTKASGKKNPTTGPMDP